MIPQPRNILDLSYEEKIKFLDSFDFVMCDCDGVLWSGMTPIENTGKAISMLQEANKKIGYISNNSGRSDIEYAELFKLSGIKAHLDDLCHTVKNIVSYFKKINFDGLIYAIGSKSLHAALTEANFKVIDEPNVAEESFLGLLSYISVEQPISAVVIHGYWNVTAPNLIRAQMYLSQNPKCLLVTGASDMFLNFRDVKILGPGKFTQMLSEVSGKKPIVLSKPGEDLTDIILHKFDIKEPKRTLMVGDMLDQDIAFGKVCGFQTLAVLTGGCKLETFSQSEYSHVLPDYYANSLGDFIEFFNNLNKNKV